MSGSFAPPSTGGSSSPNAISFSNTDRTITSGECTGDSLIVRQTGTLSATRTLTLPAASAVSAGYTIDLVDETGSPSWWFPINIIPAGSDTTGGLGSSFPLQLNLPYQAIKLISNGSNAWTFRKYDPGLQDYLLIDQDAINTTPVSGQTQAFGMSTIAASGAGAASGNVGQASGSDFPAISANSGTTSSGLSQFSTNGIIRFGAKIHRFCIRGRIPVLPDATNDFVSWVGIGNDLQQVSPNFVTFAFTYDRSTGFWRTSTIKSFAQRTFTTTSVAGDTNMHTFAGEMNAAANSAKFYIDGTLVATHTTNIETSGGGAKFGFGGAKSAGTTDRAFFEANKMQLLIYDPANRRSSM